MSMDAAVWIACLAVLPADLPESEQWIVEKWDGFSSYVYPSPYQDWQLILEKLDDSEMPLPDTVRLKPDALHGYYFSLEPLGADEKGYKVLKASIQSLPNKCGGAVVEGFNEIKLYESDK